MKKRTENNEVKKNPQLTLFNGFQNTCQITSNCSNSNIAKVVSLLDHKKQVEIKNFYEFASKSTSHIK